jgi:hypothetical protein
MNDEDEHLSIVLFSYWTAYKVVIGHTPFQLVYGLHPLLPTKYLLPLRPSEHVNPKPIKVLTSRLSELEKLQQNKLIAHDLIAFNQWIGHYGHWINSLKLSFNLETICYGFQDCF